MKHIQNTINEIEKQKQDEEYLLLAKKAELEKLENGYRYIKIGNRGKLLVKCDNNGNPLDSEKRKIEDYKL